MTRYAPLIEEAIKSKMISDKTIATGETLNSVKAKEFEMADSIGIRLRAAESFNFLNYGRRPGTPPPYKPIAKWLEKKNIPYFAGSLNKTAYIIAQSIGEKGTIKDFGYKGTNVTDRALKGILNRLLQDSSEAYIKDVEQHLKKSSKYARG